MYIPRFVLYGDLSLLNRTSLLILNMQSFGRRWATVSSIEHNFFIRASPSFSKSFFASSYLFLFASNHSFVLFFLSPFKNCNVESWSIFLISHFWGNHHLFLSSIHQDR